MLLKLPGLIDRIYKAAVVPGQWPDLLDAMSRAVGGDGGVLFTFNRDHVRWTTSANLYDIFVEFVRDGWAAINPRPVRLAAANHAGFVRDSDYFTADEMETDPVYGYYRRKGLGWTTGTMLDTPSGDSIVFSFERAHSKGPVPIDVVQQFDQLRPHLARSALLAARLGLEQAKSMADALLAIGLPGGVLNSHGRLIAGNALLSALAPAIVQDRWSRVVLSDPKSDSLFEAALNGPRDSAEAGSRSIPVAAAIDRPAMIVHLLPIKGVANDLFASAQSLLVISPEDRAVVPTAEILQGLFDLTPAEARVARRIGDAQSVDAIALALGVSRETVRSQLKAVLSKTGLSRQQELISLLAGKILTTTRPAESGLSDV
jgi:DNA-binding CsgD family transcriptional regulator